MPTDSTRRPPRRGGGTDGGAKGAPRRSTAGAQPKKAVQRGRKRPPQGAHARQRSGQRPRRTSPVIPIIIAVLALVFVGLLVVLVMRSCSSGHSSGDEGVTGTPQTVEQVEEKPQPTSINLMMVGDMLFHYQVRMSGLAEDGSRNYDHLFAHVGAELADQDIKVINQETPIAGPVYVGNAPDGYDGYPEFNGPQEVGDAEAAAGFNVILKATNHAMDNSGNFEDPYTLIRAERSFWETEHPEVTVIGQANPDDPSTSADDVYVYEKDGFKVALLNFTQDLNGNEGQDRQGIVSMLEESHVRACMAKAREMADMIVVFPHWGEEYNLEPVEMQYTWANLFVEEGADVIIGNHPHVIEPVTVLHGTDGRSVPCFWSTGNFVSTSPSDESLVGGIAKVTLTKGLDGSCAVTAASFTPIVTHLGLSDDMTTYPLYDWTDELAETNMLNTEINPDTDNSTLTPAWANEFCTQVLGPTFDTRKEILVLDVTPTAPTTSAAPTGTDAEGASDVTLSRNSVDEGSPGIEVAD